MTNKGKSSKEKGRELWEHKAGAWSHQVAKEGCPAKVTEGCGASEEEQEAI